MFKEKKAENFFNHPINFEEKDKSQEKIKKTSKKLKYAIAIIIFFIFLFSVTSWTYLNWPIVDLIIYPRFKNIEEKFDFDVVYEEGDDLNGGEIKGSLEEFEISQESTFSSSGEKFSSDKGKARGTVKIVNNYSSASQPLVATTRVLSKSGKLFRLVDSVVVPGMKDENPGEIEVKVVADKPGIEFNIEPDTFTIEGFKGNPKYEKFEVISGENMTGGSDDTENKKVKYVTQEDIDQARKETVNQINEVLENKIIEKMGEDKKFVIDSIEKEIISSEASLAEGEIGDDFTFTIKEQIKLVSFSEEDLKGILYSDLLKDADVGYEIDAGSIGIDYQKSSWDKEMKKIKVEAEVSGLMWPEINEENIKKGIVGKNEGEMQDFFKNYTEIRKIEIEYKPSWLKDFPITEDKIDIKIDQEKV